MPPLLTSCHLAQFLCRAGSHSGIAPLIALWGFFSWMLPVALVMLGGLAMAALGGALLFHERRSGHRTRQEVSMRGAFQLTAMTTSGSGRASPSSTASPPR